MNAPLFDGLPPEAAPRLPTLESTHLIGPAQALAAEAWPFGTLRPFGYGVIVADPPWRFALYSAVGAEKSPQAHYACLSTEEIAALPVDRLAGRDCWLWLWATFAMLPDALRVMASWRFGYVTGGVWIKRGTSGKLAMGTGYVLRCAAEPFLLGRIGAPPTLTRGQRNVIEAPRRQHSRKPDDAYRACERLFGPAWRADLFARERRPGWDGWGLETAKFDEGSGA